MRKKRIVSRMSLADVLIIVGAIVAAIVLIIGLSLLNVYSQLSRYKNYWVDNNQNVIAAGTIDYVAFGDSAAQGVGATSAAKGYPGLIQKELSKNQNRDIKLVNLSKSGGKIRDVLDTQLPAYRKLNVSDKTVITVEIGANDMIDFEPKKFEKEMDELMDKLPSQTIISDIPYFGGSRLGRLESNVIAANKIMYKLAEKHGFELVQLHDKVQNNTGILTLAPDLFHPSNNGYRENWAPVFLDRIERN